MTFPTVAVTVSLAALAGVAQAGITVTATMDKDDRYGGFIVQSQVSGVTDGSGNVVLQLFPNNPTTGLGTTGSVYYFFCSIPLVGNFHAVAQVPNAACDLATIAMINPTPVASDAQVASSQAAASAAAARADRLLADADVVLTHADVVLTHADVVLTHADVVLTHADVVTANTGAATATAQAVVASAQAGVATAQAGIATTQATAAAASQVSAGNSASTSTSAAATAGAYPNAASSNVPQGLTQTSVGAITAGAGGANGTFALAWSGGNFLANPTGMFTVAGGVLTAVTITGPGLYIGGASSTPTPSFAASAGLAGAAVALVAQFLVASGQGYWVQSPDGASLIRYRSLSGVATLDAAVTPVPSYQADAAPRQSRTIESTRGNDGSFIAGTRADGLRVRWNNPSGRRVYSRLVGGKQQVFIAADGLGESQLTFTGNNSAPEITVDRILFSSDRRGFPEPYFMGLDGMNQAPAALQITEHFQVTGQSLATGEVCAAALSTTNVDSRAKMLSLSVGGAYGPRTMLDSTPINDDTNIDITKVTGLTALVEAVRGTRGETISSGFSAQYLRNQPATEKIVLDVHGRGSASYLNNGSDPWLSPSGTHYTNGITFQELVRKYVEAAGGAYRFAGLLNIHGHADAFRARGRANYLADLQAWRVAYNHQTRHRSTLHRQQQMFLSQLSNLRYSGVALQQCLDISLAQLDAQKLGVGIMVVTPAYIFQFADTDHMTAAGNRQHGEYFGKVARRVLKEGLVWEPVYPKAWTRSGTIINVQFNVPVAPLVLDTSIVTDPGQSGFSYIDDTASGITVTAVAVAADGVSVNVTLSGTGFGTNPRFRIAGTQTGNSTGPALGARSTLRDSDAEKGALSGLPLYNYACHFEGAIV